jgi:hypothetical protein
MKLIFEVLVTTLGLLIDAIVKVVILFNTNLNVYFEKHRKLHWIFCGLAFLLALYGYLTGDTFDLISSAIVGYLCCPLRILPFFLEFLDI